jgi:hypothetical protein
MKVAVSVHRVTLALFLACLAVASFGIAVPPLLVGILGVLAVVGCFAD